MVFAKPETCEIQRMMFCGFAVDTEVSQCYVSYFLLGSVDTHMMFSNETQALVCALFTEHKPPFHTEDDILLLLCPSDASELYNITSTKCL